MTKKFLSLFLAITMLLGVGSIASAEETVEIEWFITASALPETWDLNQPIFKTITEKTGVTCAVNIPAQDADTKLNLMITAKTLPDMITMNNDDLIKEMIANDLVWDLEELMRTYMPDSHIFTDLPQDIKDGLIKKYGGWYAFPSHIKTKDGAAIWGYPTEEIAENYNNQTCSDQFSFFFNTEVLKTLNIDVKSINTEEKLFEVMAQIDAANLTNSEGASIYTVLIPATAWDEMGMRPLKYQFGTMPWDEEGNYRSEYYAPEYRHAVEFLNKCYQLGYLEEGVMAMDGETAKTACNSGRVAIYIGGISALNMGHDDEWATPGPVLSSTGASPVFPLSSKVDTGWLKTFVSKRCKNPEAVARFIDYMSGREGMLLHMYGIEGVDYTWDEEGMLHRTETGFSKIEDKVSGMYGFYAFHHTNFSRSAEYLDVSNASDLMTALGSSDLVYKYDSSVLDLPVGYVEAGSDYAFIRNEVGTYVQSNLGKVITAKDDETFNKMFDELLAKLDKLGLREYDEYVNIAVQQNAAEIGLDLKTAQPRVYLKTRIRCANC